MNQDEKTVYLANIIHIAGVDGKVEPQEAMAIEKVCPEIGAAKEELEKALQMAAGGNHNIKPIGRFSDMVRNLEDMMFVSLVDGEFSKAEKPEIISFAKAIKVSQDQINNMLKEAKERCQGSNNPCACSSCSKEVPADSTFCPFCGGKI